jgi:hypothetical protein
LFFFRIIDAPENNIISRDPGGNNIIQLSAVPDFSLVRHFKITIGIGIEDSNFFIIVPERSVPDRFFHLVLQTDLITFEYKIIAAKVKKDQPGKKDRKKFPYHLVFQGFYPLFCKSIKLYG